MKRKIVYCVLFLALTGIAYGGQTSRVELTDGSVINAEVISFDQGTYTLDAGALGQIRIEASRIRSISTPTKDASSPNSSADSKIVAGSNADLAQSRMEDVRTEMVNNPGIMQIIRGLAADPQFQEVLKDPDVVAAIKSQDIKALTSNEKFMKLLGHPAIKEIEDKLTGDND